jgi:hypothetical protein
MASSLDHLTLPCPRATLVLRPWPKDDIEPVAINLLYIVNWSRHAQEKLKTAKERILEIADALHEKSHQCHEVRNYRRPFYTMAQDLQNRTQEISEAIYLAKRTQEEAHGILRTQLGYDSETYGLGHDSPVSLPTLSSSGSQEPEAEAEASGILEFVFMESQSVFRFAK